MAATAQNMQDVGSNEIAQAVESEETKQSFSWGFDILTNVPDDKKIRDKAYVTLYGLLKRNEVAGERAELIRGTLREAAKEKKLPQGVFDGLRDVGAEIPFGERPYADRLAWLLRILRNQDAPQKTRYWAMSQVCDMDFESSDDLRKVVEAFASAKIDDIKADSPLVERVVGSRFDFWSEWAKAWTVEQRMTKRAPM